MTMVGALAGFVFWTLAARSYSQAEVGIASAVISVIQLLSGIAGLGLGMGLMRFLANAYDAERLLNTAFTLVLIASLLVGGLYFAGIQRWSPGLSFMRVKPYLALGFIGFLMATSLGTLTKIACIGFRKARYAFLQAVAMNGMRVVLILLLVQFGATGIITALATGVVVADGLGLLVYLPRAANGFRVSLRWSTQAIAELVPFSGGNYLSDIFLRAPILIAPLLVLEVIGPESTAHIYVAWMIGSILSSPGTALADSAFAEGAHTPEDLSRIFSKSMKLAVGVTFPLALIVAIASPWILKIFGNSYSSASSFLLSVLALAVPFAVANSVYFSVLRIRKRVVELVILSALVAGISIGVAILGLKQIGLVSTGIGWLLSQIVVTLILSRHLLQRTIREGVHVPLMD